jgi:tryptophanyl-tRNA synthetase
MRNQKSISSSLPQIRTCAASLHFTFTMARYLTGVQSSGVPHLGNILGAILPSIRFSEQTGNECIYFIADYHSLTTIKSAEERMHNVHSTAAAWLAFGFDHEKNILFRQSDVKQVLELTWILSCFTPFPMLANAHSFKDKSERLSDVNAGLFTYPVLMAADILLYDTEFVPVGKDQIQHIEIARDIASAFNRHYQTEALTLPKAALQKDGLTIPGTDGAKMSKSYGNFIDVFSDEKALRKTIMGIKTDSTPMEEPKDPEKDTVFSLYQLISSQQEATELAALYRGGNFGYGHAKQMLFEKCLQFFGPARERFAQLMADPDRIESILSEGALKAAIKAEEVLGRVKSLTGFR